MSAIDEMRAELGIDRLEAKLDELLAAVGDINRTKPFYKPSEVANLLGKRIQEVDAMLADGRLWMVEGLGSSKRVIPQAAVDSLQARPSHLKVVGE